MPTAFCYSLARLAIASFVACLHIGCASQVTEPVTMTRANSVNFTLAGAVVAVEDGDTLTLQTSNAARFVVRLSDLDTPEIFHKAAADRSCPGRVLRDRPGQPLGREARRSLQALALRKDARAECYEVDRFGRPVCHVFIAGRNINLEQIERGWGMLAERTEWVRDPASREAEARARARRAGVWASTDPLHPGAWREQCWNRGQCAGAES
jgi:micrococcal nuclease